MGICQLTFRDGNQLASFSAFELGHETEFFFITGTEEDEGLKRVLKRVA